jgi:hypothetical protein
MEHVKSHGVTCLYVEEKKRLVCERPGFRSSQINERKFNYIYGVFVMPSSVANPAKDEVPDESLAEDDRWLLAKRIASSATFARSTRLSHLLLYLCEQNLSGRDALLTEQNIAAHVFDRARNFDPTADTIVRSHILRLRQKLEVYFAEEGLKESIRILIPKGGYVPAFESVQPSPTIPQKSELPDEAEAGAAAESDIVRGFERRQKRLLIACAVLTGLCVLMALFLWRKEQLERSKISISEHSVRHQLWSRLFPPGSNTMLVAADSGLVMLHGLTQQNSTLSEYVDRNYNKELSTVTTMQPGVALSIASRRYTSFVDLELFDRLTHLPEALTGHYKITYARDLHANDFKDSNIVLSGSQDANPWVELFEPQMNFVLQNDLPKGIRAFANRNPQPGEQKVYVSQQFEYGVLAFLPNLSGTGSVLLIEGTSVAGTEAISDFLFEDSTLEPFLTKISKQDGSLPHFEILLESKSLNGSAAQSKIVAYRIHSS